MPRSFRLQIVTPERVIMDAPVTSVIAPGVEGSFGVLAGHAPMVTELGVGELRYRDEGGVEHVMALHAGFMQVTGDRSTVLADAAERPAEIDVSRAEEARDRAREEQRRLVERYSEAEATRVKAALARSLNRLRAAGRG